jgi:cytohesin
MAVNMAPPLVAACSKGHTEIVRYLLQKGANVESRNDFGITALHKAARGGHADIVKMLLAAGARVDQPDDEGRTALYLSCMAGRAESVQLLLQHGSQIRLTSNVFRNVLYAAVASGSKPVVELILAQLQRPDLHDLVDLEDTGITPLQESLCKPLKVEIAKLLLLNGADIWMGFSTSPLELIAESGCLDEMVHFLFDNKLITRKDINKRDALYGKTLLHWASRNDKTHETVKFLLENGANHEMKDKNGFSPLDCAKNEKGRMNANLLGRSSL